jgi:hypothetical protein
MRFWAVLKYFCDFYLSRTFIYLICLYALGIACLRLFGFSYILHLGDVLFNIHLIFSFVSFVRTNKTVINLLKLRYALMNLYAVFVGFVAIFTIKTCYLYSKLI